VTTLTLPRVLVNQLLGHAQQNPEQEICGLIGQKDNIASSYYRIDNTAGDKTHRYYMDEHQLIDTMRTMRQNGETLLAIVHSHPSSAAQPSLHDIEQANYPEVYYLIISLNTRGVLEMRAYKIEAGSFASVVVNI
jgi:[CysO sulfur-carrier protein]-S-L-cysteine hydrolase